MTKFSVVRNEYGYATAIKYGNQYILHLIPGTKINEKFVDIIIDRLNGAQVDDMMLCDMVKKLREE